MISDSLPWRNELARLAVALREYASSSTWDGRTEYDIERDVMLGMFVIRRLIEAYKSSSRLPTRRVKVRHFRLLGEEPRPLDRWSVERYYDLKHPQSAELDVESLFHEFIHSFILSIYVDEQHRPVGVFIASERTKRRHIYEVDLTLIADLYDYVADENVWYGLFTRDEGSIRLSQHDLIEVGLIEAGEGGPSEHIDESTLRNAFPDLKWPPLN